MQPFTFEELEEVMGKLKELPPIAKEIQVFRKGYEVIMSNASVLDDFRKEELGKEHGYIGKLSGIRILTIDDYADSEMKINQGRVIYSDGTSKIINIFN